MSNHPPADAGTPKEDPMSIRTTPIRRALRPGTIRRRLGTTAALAALLAVTGLAACGDDDDADVLTLETVDFAYRGVPREVEVGTRLEIENSSTVEVHEAVVFRVPDDKAATPLADLLAAAQADPTALGEFVGVAVALPEAHGEEPEGPVVFDRPGRYVIACFVPTGSDPEVYRQAIENGAAPEPTDAPPHVAHGMVAEVSVK